MASPAEQLGALERAVQEVEALEAIYGFDAGGFTVCMLFISTVDQPIERVTIQALDCC